MHPILVLLLMIVLLVTLFRRTFPLRLLSKGFKYVYVNEDGSVRELKFKEKVYLQKEYKYNDSARPYIKNHYWQRCLDSKLNGYLLKSRVPWWIDIESTETR